MVEDRRISHAPDDRVIHDEPYATIINPHGSGGKGQRVGINAEDPKPRLR